MPESYFVWYRSYTPDGKLWCSTDSADFFLEYNARWTGDEPLISEKNISAKPSTFATN